MGANAVWVVGGGLIALVAAAGPVFGSEPSAAQIVEKNIAARGGLEAWRKIQSVIWIGHIERADAPGANMPFVLEMKRPDKTRFEIRTPEQMAVHVYDGAHGWKLRAARGGQPDVQPYTAAELSYAHDAPGIDGPLMDYQAKGVAVALDGVDEVEGRKAYRLNVRLPSGASHHTWIDAESFLEIKYDRESRNVFGKPATVVVWLRDYRTIDGLQIPFTIVSQSATTPSTDKMVIDKILINPPLDDRMFAKPWTPSPPRHMMSIDATHPAALRRPDGAARSVSKSGASPPGRPWSPAGEGG